MEWIFKKFWVVDISKNKSALVNHNILVLQYYAFRDGVSTDAGSESTS
jgi:hypothetical protein